MPRDLLEEKLKRVILESESGGGGGSDDNSETVGVDNSIAPSALPPQTDIADSCDKIGGAGESFGRHVSSCPPTQVDVTARDLRSRLNASWGPQEAPI